MKLALGLIETRGLVAAIEAADAMAKASNVTIVGKEKSTAALVTIKIVGEVAAVKSAVDAGAAAAQKIGEVLSTHIIPRPAEEIAELINSTRKIISTSSRKAAKRRKKNRVVDAGESLFDSINPEVESVSIEEKKTDMPDIPENANLADSMDVNQDDFEEEFADVDIEFSVEDEIDKSDDLDEEDNDETLNDESSIIKMEDLEILNVHQLRRKARNYPNFPIKGRDISKANRGVLLDHFKSLL